MRLALSIAGASLLLVLWGGGCSGEKDTDPSPPEVAQQAGALTTQRVPLVRGYLAVRLGDNDKLPYHDVYLPGANVYLREVTSGATTEPRLTDLSGRFTLPAYKGAFVVCWQAKNIPEACDGQRTISAGATLVNVGTVRIVLPFDSTTAAVFGTVKLADGSAPRRLSPLDSVNAFARVRLEDKSGGQLDEAYVNNFGEYVLPRVPNKESVALVAFLEKAESRRAIEPDANLAGSRWHQIDLRLGNTPPRVDPISVKDDTGRWVRSAAPGATVHLSAPVQDKDGHPVRYLWRVDEGSGSLSSTSDPGVKWTLPPVRGQFSVSLLVWDEYGGYTRATTSLRTEGAFVPFSGTVTDYSGAPQSGVKVEIISSAGTVTTTTNTAGFFRTFAKDGDRYVFNLRKTGFGLVSQIYDRGIMGGVWQMQRATVVSVNPTLAIDVTSQRSSSECPGRGSEALDWTRYAALRTPQWQDGKGNVVPAPRESPPLPLPNPQKPTGLCGPGMRVQIPANALVDSLGRAPTGNVDIAVTTVDLKSSQMPGDFTTRALTGETLVAQSFGAGTVEITSGNTKYNLKSGVTATVTIAVDPTQTAAGAVLPTTMPVLYYDETLGIWKEELSATLNSTRTAYVAQVPHFSVINMDLVKKDQACVRILSPSLPATYKLEVAVPIAGAAPKYVTQTITNSAPKKHALYNLPTNTNIVLVPYDDVTRIPFGVFVVNTGGAQNPTTPNQPAGPDYAACATEVVFQQQTLPDPHDEFLQGLTSFVALNMDELDPSNPTQLALLDELDAGTGGYYAQIDPRNKRTSLAGFKTTNGFGITPEVRVVYANKVDLGFGRDMHCVKNPNDEGNLEVACYVSNYGDIDSPDIDDVAAASAAGTPVATVAMEYSRIESPDDGSPTAEYDDPERVVKFYVYGADGGRLFSANLDKEGARPIPQLCMVCHNGEYPTGDVPDGGPSFPDRESVKLKAKFLPFDLHAYEFLGAGSFTKTLQQVNFETLNQDYVLGTDPGTGITNLVNAWYDGGVSIQNENVVLTAWQNATKPIQDQMYRDVVARSCRTCHVSQLAADLVFDQASQVINRLGNVEARVCVDHVMPHSKMTHELFWHSTGPNQVGVLQLFGGTFGNAVTNGWNGTKCGTYVPGGTTPVTFYESTIQPIWDANCVMCHVVPISPAGLNLNAGVSRGQIVNVTATESAMKRVTPSDTGNSYLYRKITGTHTGAPANGSGGRMPPGVILDAGTLNDVSTWITTGANP